MAAAAQEALGPVDLLVNNAGRFGPVGPLAATDPDQWWQALEVNLRGPLYCMRRCCRACSLGATGGSSTSPAASA